MIFNMTNYLRIKRSILVTKMHYNPSRYAAAELNDIDEMLADIAKKANIQAMIDETIREVTHEYNVENSFAA